MGFSIANEECMPDSRVTELSKTLKEVTAEQIASAAQAVERARKFWQERHDEAREASRKETSATNALIEARRQFDATMEAFNRELPRESR